MKQKTKVSTSSPGPVHLEQVKKHSVFINLQVDLPKCEIDRVFPSHGVGVGPLVPADSKR